MRLWHYRLLPYLPNSQLLAQKRECDLIWKDILNGKKTNHILINYIWEYENPKIELEKYYRLLRKEYDERGFKFKSKIDIKDYEGLYNPKPFEKHHNARYLLECFWNLAEKYDRQQKDFSDVRYKKLENFVFGDIKLKEIDYQGE